MRAAIRFIGLLFLLSAFFAAQAHTAPSAAIHAKPALWHVQGPLGEVYLFGSIHVLPPNIEWHTPAIDKAIARSDVFVFELPSNGAAIERMQQLVAAHGYLPPGENLRGKLNAAEQAQFDAALTAAGLSPAAMERARPWLASLQLMFAQIAKAGYGVDSGIDSVLEKQMAHKQQRYLETVEQQFALLAPDDPVLELNEFRSDLKDLAKADDNIGELVKVWSRGDIKAIDKLMNDLLNDFPDARKALLDDRNARWSLQIQTMLREKRIFFVTVGAAHLAGPAGVPALLRKAGYRVIGP